MNKEKLIEWCELNLVPTDESKIEDILNGYNGSCHTHDGKIITYFEIRNMFDENDGEE